MVFPAIIVAMRNAFLKFGTNPFSTMVILASIVVLAWCFPGDGVLSFGKNYAISMFDAKVAAAVLLYIYLTVNLCSKSNSGINRKEGRNNIME
jgi:hypothetical protein